MRLASLVYVVVSCGLCAQRRETVPNCSESNLVTYNISIPCRRDPPKRAAPNGRGTLAFVVRDVLEPESLGAEALGQGLEVVSVAAPRHGITGRCCEEDAMSSSTVQYSAAKTAGRGNCASHGSKTSKITNIMVSSAYSASVRDLMPACATETNRKTLDGKSTIVATNHEGIPVRRQCWQEQEWL